MKKFGDLLIGIAVIAVLLSIIGAFASDVWLASTQWLLVAIIISIWAVYVKLRD